MSEPATSLPFVDEHARSVAAPVDRTWAAVDEYVGSRLRARTYAAFPGRRGRAYLTMLRVGTGHRRATERMLRSIGGRARTNRGS